LIASAGGWLEQRREAILAHEIATARAIAARVVEKPALSVWMILVPLVFLHHMQRQQVYRHGVSDVAEELLRTRRRALDFACRMMAGDEQVEGPGAAVPDADEPIRRIRAAEQAEVAVLVRHYSKLLSAEGRDYRTLAQRAYGDAAAYARVLEEIAEAEGEVSAAAFRAQREMDGSAELFQRLEVARSQLRAAELEALFGRGGRQVLK
jgi:hypothetical protein